jgi:hypothetical protein
VGRESAASGRAFAVNLQIGVAKHLAAIAAHIDEVAVRQRIDLANEAEKLGALGAAVFDLGDNACESHIQGPFFLLPEYLQERAALQYQMPQCSISQYA